MQINKNLKYIATLVKCIKHPYIKEALLKNGNRTIKPVPKLQEEKTANSYQKKIIRFLIKQEKNNKVAKAIKTV